MELTREEQRKIGEAGAKMMQSFAELQLAVDRLNTMSSLSKAMLQMEMSEEMKKGAVKPYEDEFQARLKEFYEGLGIGEDNVEFWEWCQEKDKEKEKGIREGEE